MFTFNMRQVAESLTTVLCAMLVITITWQQPTQRVNGDVVTIEDISGYEIRVSCDEQDYEYFLVDSDELKFEASNVFVTGVCAFEVAAIDQYGIYSKYNDKIVIDFDEYNQSKSTIEAPVRGGIR